MHGDGSNGKSVFIGLLTKLHCVKNVGNVPLSSLIGNHFALSDLEYKDINVDTELSATAAIKDTSLLKRLTGGRKQPVRVEKKYQKAYDTYLYAKMFFNTNTIAETADQTTAYFHREIIMGFPNKFENKTDDPHILDKLTTQEELSAIFNVLMPAMRTLLKNNGLYFNDKTSEERRRKHERAVDPVKAFVAEAIADDSTESDYVIKAHLYVAFKKYCKKYSLATKSIEAVGKDLKKLHWNDGKEGSGEKRRTYWIGRRLTPEYTIMEEQQLVTSFA